MLVGSAGDYWAFAPSSAFFFGFRKFDYLIVVVFLLEVFAVGEKVEEFIGGLFRFT